MPGEIRRLGGPAMTGNILWACAGNPCEIDDLAGDKRGIIEPPDAQCNVNVFTDDIDQAVGHQEIKRHMWVPRHKVRQYWTKVINRDGWQCMHAQLSARRQGP